MLKDQCEHNILCFQEDAWRDLRPAERAAAGTSLILGLEEVAVLVADTVTNEKNLVDVTPNILSSVRVMEARDAGLQTFPSLDSLHLAEAARLEVPAEAVRGQAVNGAVRMIMMMRMMISIMMMIMIMMMMGCLSSKEKYR